MVSPATAVSSRPGDAPGPASTTPSLSSPSAGTTSSSAALPSADDAPTRRRRQAPGPEKTAARDVMRDHDRSGLLGRPPPAAAAASWTTQNRWIVLAIASGACAAFNGVFAKLTTNSLTSQISQAITGALGLDHIEGAIEFVFRCMFFGLNLAFNGVMWTLFTKALARGSSTTQVSIMNTSANFVVTALLGLAIFAESLPPLWWLGAALLVAGNVIIGRKDDGDGGDGDSDSVPPPPPSEDPSLPSPASPGPHGGVAAYGAVSQADGGSLPADGEPKDEDVPLIGDVETVV